MQQERHIHERAMNGAALSLKQLTITTVSEEVH